MTTLAAPRSHTDLDVSSNCLLFIWYNRLSMKNNEDIPQVAIEAFPVISDATFVRRLTSPIPLVPDTIFNIYIKNTEDFIALVITDYANPQHQSIELKNISGQYGFEFINLVKPYNNSGETIEVLDNDEMEGSFFVTAPHQKYRLYYYLANLRLHN